MCCVGVALAGGGFTSQFRAGAAAAIWITVILGIAFGAWPRARIPGRALVAGGALLALALLTALSVAWSLDDGAVFGETVRVAGYLGLFVLIVVASPPGSARLWLQGLALGLLAVAGLAVASRVEPSLFPDQDLGRLIPSVRTRLSYPVNYWNGLAAMMAIALVLLVWLGAHARTRVGRALAVAALPLPALALFLTSSRGGIVALAVGLVVLVAMAPARARLLAGALLGGTASAAVIVFANGQELFVDARTDAAGAAAEGRAVLAVLLLVATLAGALRFALDPGLNRIVVPRPVAVGAVAAFAAAVVVGLGVAGPAQLLDEFNDPPSEPGPARGYVARHLASAEGSGRYQFWQTGVNAFETEPLRGIGAGGYEAWWAREGSLAYYIRDAHSLFVETLAELGMAGLIALLIFLVAAASGAVAARAPDAGDGPAAKSAAAAVLACGTASAAIDWTWEVPAVYGPALVAAAVLASPAVTPWPGRGAPRFGLGLATLAIGWLAAVAATIAFVTEIRLDDSREAARRGDFANSLAAAVSARSVQPWSGAPYLQTALVRERLGDLRGARQAAGEAVDRDRDDWRVWLVVARLALRDGDVEAARRALAQARMLNPRSPLFDSDPQQ